jgi:peptidoglycan hydrolase-like protein with peptidoglycan-binding domain
MRVITKETLASELERARRRGWERVLVATERAEGLPRGLLFAIASQETDMNDVVGDGGHGRGLFQIDDRSHGRFLSSQGAARSGGKPPVDAAARYAAELVKANLDYGSRNGIRGRDLLKFALSAYNAGPGGALTGYREGDSDRRTTGGDYGKAVLGRLALFESLLDGSATELRRGARGRGVEELKGRLAAWYAKHAPGEWERFAVKPGPHFGVALDRALRDFQRRVRLEPDGIAGPLTQRALDRS